MNHAKSFLRDLDDAVSRGTADSRTRALWHATDLLIAGGIATTEIWTFGEVIWTVGGCRLKSAPVPSLQGEWPLR